MLKCVFKGFATPLLDCLNIGTDVHTMYVCMETDQFLFLNMLLLAPRARDGHRRPHSPRPHPGHPRGPFPPFEGRVPIALHPPPNSPMDHFRGLFFFSLFRSKGVQFLLIHLIQSKKVKVKVKGNGPAKRMLEKLMAECDCKMKNLKT